MGITIGLPVYNAGPFLGFTINSILNQSFTNWELIIIDDGSTDDSLEIALSFKDSRIRVLSDGYNKRLPTRLNQINRLANHEYIARMDADDLIHPERLKIQYDFLNTHTHIDLISTGVVSFRSNGTVVGTRFTKSGFEPTFFQCIQGNSGIIHASVVARKEWFLRNPYDESCIQAEDYKLWVDAKFKNDLKVAYHEDFLYFYREDQNITYKKMKSGYFAQIKVLCQRKYHILFLQRVYLVSKLLAKFFVLNIIFLTRNEEWLHSNRVNDVSSNSLHQIKLKSIIFPKNPRHK